MKKDFDAEPLDTDVPMQTQKQKPTHEVRLGHIKAVALEKADLAPMRNHHDAASLFLIGNLSFHETIYLGEFGFGQSRFGRRD